MSWKQIERERSGTQKCDSLSRCLDVASPPRFPGYSTARQSSSNQLGDSRRTGRELTLPRLITGAQNDENPLPAFIIARPSRPICAPVTCQRVRLKLMPVVIGKANLVVCVLLWWISFATPVEASDHQLYAGVSSPLMAAPLVSRLAIFSCSVMRPTASFTLASRGSE